MILEKKYAQALDDLTKNKSSDDVNIIFSNFISVLKKKGHYTILPKILKSLENLKQREKSDNIEFIIASKEQEDKFKPRFDEFKRYFSEKAKIKTEIDETIIGGFIIKSKSIIIDGSYKKALMNLYNKFTS
jgi:F-type H+-transporting ATPase subunit delta